MKLNFDSIEKFYQIINRKTNLDIVAASWIVNNKIIKPKKNLELFMECSVYQAVTLFLH